MMRPFPTVVVFYRIGLDLELLYHLNDSATKQPMCGLCSSEANLLGFLYEVHWLPRKEEERDGGCNGDDEDVVHPDVVGDGGEEDEEEEDGDGVEGRGEESPDDSLWQ